MSGDRNRFKKVRVRLRIEYEVVLSGVDNAAGTPCATALCLHGPPYYGATRAALCATISRLPLSLVLKTVSPCPSALAGETVA